MPNYQEQKLLDIIGDKLNNSQCNKEDGSLVIELQAIAASDIGKQIILNSKNKVRVQLEVNKGVGKEIEFLLTRSTLKIGKELVIVDKEQVNQLLSSKLKMEIISDNIEKVRENPRLVFSRIPPDKPVFDQEGLQIAVNEVLLEIRDKKGQVIGKIDIADTLDNKEANKKEESVVNQQLTAAGLELCEYLTSNEEVVLVCREDLQGKRLFAFRQTLELEENFMEVVQELNKSFNHKLVVGSADNKEKILEQNRVLSEKRGLTLSNQQRQVVEELLQGADIVALEGLPGSGKSTVMREVVKQLTEIVFNYPSFEELLPKYNVNFQTVLKHAGAKEYSYGVSSKDLERSNNKHWLALLEHIVSLDTREEDQLLVEEGLDKARRLVAIVREDLQVVKGKLARVEKQLTELINNRDKQQRELINAKRFTGKLLPYFLQERYKNAPSLVIKNWQELISELGVAKAIKKVEKNPSLLGEVNKYAGDSVENKLTNEGVVANKCKLIDSLQEYENSKLTIQSSNKLLDNEVEEVSKEKTKLRTLLLNHQEQKMLNLMDEILNKSQLAKDTNNIMECLRSIATYRGTVIDEFISHGEYQDREQKEINLEQEEINLNKQKEISLEQEETNFNKKNKKEIHPEVQKVLDSLNESKKLPSRNIGKSNNPLYQELILKRMVESKLEKSDISFEELSQRLTREDFANLFSSYVMNINPNGKIRRQSNQISCGSVNMNLDNGLWYRFSTGDKGNIFSFVAQAKNIKESQALKLIVRAFGFVKIGGELKRLGNDDSSFWTSDIKQDITSDIKQDITYKQARSEEQWIAFKIVPKEAESFNAEKHLSHMLKNNNLEAIYKYYNIDNQLIGYTVRLIEKNGDGKQVLPVSYCRDDQSNEQKWCLKGFTDDLGNKPIYGAEKLANGDVPVLIVEGEKTANIAQGLLPEYSVISWLGGSKAAGKVNWQILAGRRVVIWPDNDQPGFAAARAIQQKLQGVANCCMVVDPRVLAVADKWDLGDTIPTNVNIRSALVAHHHPQSIEIVDQQIRALNYHGRDNEQLSNEQLIILLEEQAIAWLQQEGKDNDQYRGRLDHELTVISQTGFAKDFIIAANIAKYCNHMQIAIGPGRGSAVSSLVAYSLGIHRVDPVENKLLFGRFLTEKTTSNPDFDFDIASTQKILVENYLLAKYSNATKLAVVNNRGDKTMSIHPAGIGIVPDTIKDQLPYSTISGHYWNDRPLLAIDHKQAEQLGVKKFDLLSSHATESLQKAENLLQANSQSNRLDQYCLE